MKFLRQHRGEVIPRDPGEARDRASGTGVTVVIIPIDPTLNFYARAPVLDHLTMPDGDSRRFQQLNSGDSQRWFNVDDALYPA